MKKHVAPLIIALAAFATNVFAQDGYVVFAAPSHTVFDEFTTPGTGVFAPGDVETTFLWALTGTADPLGTEVATTGVNYTASNWSTISSMVSSGWNIAEDAGNGNAEADVAVYPIGAGIGSIG